MKNKLAMMTAAALMTATLGLSNVQPARADQAAVTRNTILGIAALVAGAVIAGNVSQKYATANTVEGYTRDGGTVYADGHVAYGNGSSYYPNDHGQSISCDGYGACTISGPGYTAANGGWNGQNGRRYHR
jgi:hypothetical protein